MKTNIPMKEVYDLVNELQYICIALQATPINEGMTKEEMCQWTYNGLSDDLQWHRFICSNHPMTHKRETAKIPAKKDK
jgi:hypothetical protein